MVAFERLSPPPLKRVRKDPDSSDANPRKNTSTVGSSQRDLRLEGCRGSISIYSWNVNGITAFLPSDSRDIASFFHRSTDGAERHRKEARPIRPSIRRCLRNWQWPEVVGLQEIKIAASDEKCQSALRREVNSALEDEATEASSRPLYDVHLCLPTDKYNATGVGGGVHGVCTLVRRDLPHAEVRMVNWDLEGRVLICELNDSSLAIINVYALNGTDYDYRDASSGKVIGTRHDRKRVFHRLLAAEVEEYQSKGWSVIVAGDINISRSQIDSYPQLRLGESHVRNRADFEEKFMVELGMIDTFRQIHNEERKYSYRPPQKPWGSGMDRVDMILASRTLRECVLQADILDTEKDRGPSDHVPLFVQIKGFPIKSNQSLEK